MEVLEQLLMEQEQPLGIQPMLIMRPELELEEAPHLREEMAEL
jgi:hypothetical protein